MKEYRMIYNALLNKEIMSMSNEMSAKFKTLQGVEELKKMREKNERQRKALREFEKNKLN